MEHFNLRQVFAVQQTERSQRKGKFLLYHQDVILALVSFLNDFQYMADCNNLFFSNL